jgi:hypothetical protein
MRTVANLIGRTLKSRSDADGRLADQVRELAKAHPIYPELA